MIVRAIRVLRAIMFCRPSRSKTSSSTSSIAVTVAVRWMRLTMAISPKKSPFSRTEMTFVFPANRLLTRTLPVWMMYISSPSSPSRQITDPGVYLRLNLCRRSSGMTPGLYPNRSPA